jgi:hypothetical protein
MYSDMHICIYIYIYIADFFAGYQKFQSCCKALTLFLSRLSAHHQNSRAGPVGKFVRFGAPEIVLLSCSARLIQTDAPMNFGDSWP